MATFIPDRNREETLMDLKSYIKDNGLKMVFVAEQARITYETLWRACGGMRPTGEVQNRIVTALSEAKGVTLSVSDFWPVEESGS